MKSLSRFFLTLSILLLGAQFNLYAGAVRHSLINSATVENTFAEFSQHLLLHTGKARKSVVKETPPHAKKRFFKLTITDDNDEDEELALAVVKYLNHCNFFAVFFGTQPFPALGPAAQPLSIPASKAVGYLTISRHIALRILRL